jgi:hypothetical protein
MPDRYAFYDRMKAYTAAPPDVLRVDASTGQIGEWCLSRQTLMEGRPVSRWQRLSTARALHSIGARRLRRVGREWIWRLSASVAEDSAGKLAAGPAPIERRVEPRRRRDAHEVSPLPDRAGGHSGRVL